jgi:hypothetical protein
VGGHVIYESRLELGRLLFADFAPDVRHIVAQPFLLKADVDGKVRRHIPDYLLLTDDGPVTSIRRRVSVADWCSCSPVMSSAVGGRAVA